MRLLAILTGVLIVLGGLAAFAFPHARAYWKERNKPTYRQAEVTRGEIVAVVNATGTIQPVLRVQVGSSVSGPITQLLADFNDEVTKGQLLAKVDPRTYEAAVARDKASLATREAEVKRVEAMLQQAVNDEQRANELRELRDDFISETEMDQLKFNRISMEAQLEVAKASVTQAKAAMANSEFNLGYTDIKSPVDGTVIDRKIDEGQTLAAQFQAPELFIVAPNMREKMHVFASVDEADIGRIREAQKDDRPVKFRVDAYPDDLFEGRIDQIRVNPTTEQNVVTYPVVLEAANPELKLLPGMTANISFETGKCEDVLKIPNAALRFYPQPEQVRKEDRKILEGTDDAEEDSTQATNAQPSATETVEASKKRARRHVWVVDGDLLKAVEVVVGLNDYRYSELVEGELEEGHKLVTGVGAPGSE